MLGRFIVYHLWNKNSLILKCVYLACFTIPDKNKKSCFGFKMCQLCLFWDLILKSDTQNIFLKNKKKGLVIVSYLKLVYRCIRPCNVSGVQCPQMSGWHIRNSHVCQEVTAHFHTCFSHCLCKYYRAKARWHTYSEVQTCRPVLLYPNKVS